MSDIKIDDSFSLEKSDDFFFDIKKSDEKRKRCFSLSRKLTRR